MTSREFARLVGVSQATVSRAMNNSPLVTVETRAMIQARAAELGFELNSQAQSLKTRKTGNVGLLFPPHFRSMTDNLMLAHFYDRIQRELIRKDYDVMTIYDAPGEGMSPLERVIKRRKVDGIISFRSVLSRRERELIDGNGFPCVSMLSAPRMAPELHYCVVDGEAGGFLAGDFFGAHPGFRPVFVGIEEEREEASARLRGFRRGLAGHGAVLDDADVFFCSVSFESARDLAAREFGELKRKTAFLAYNDIVGMGIAAALWEAEVRIPGQAQILGMDDLPLSSWRRPHLSTLGFPIDEMVSAGCSMLRALMEGGKPKTHKRKYKPRLILRDTTLRQS